MSITPMWKTVPDLNFRQGIPSTISIAEYLTPETFGVKLVGTPPAGVTFDAPTKTFAYDGKGDLAEVAGFRLEAIAPATVPEPTPTPVPTQPSPAPAGPVPATAPTEPGSWAMVGIEGATMTLPIGTLVRYGATDTWLYVRVGGTFQATNGYFGRDPVPNVVKSVQRFAAAEATPPAPVGTLADKVITILKPGEGSATLRKGLANINWMWFDERNKLTSSGKGAQLQSDGSVTVTIRTALAKGKKGLVFYDNRTATNALSYVDKMLEVVIP